MRHLKFHLVECTSDSSSTKATILLYVFVGNKNEDENELVYSIHANKSTILRLLRVNCVSEHISNGNSQLLVNHDDDYLIFEMWQSDCYEIECVKVRLRDARNTKSLRDSLAKRNSHSPCDQSISDHENEKKPETKKSRKIRFLNSLGLPSHASSFVRSFVYEIQQHAFQYELWQSCRIWNAWKRELLENIVEQRQHMKCRFCSIRRSSK